ncbi:hypothetical protein KEM09_12700 [Carboxylicivirga mesophila]|uniref:Uncharacterized protein n=1 Tax=Carboxylicivirga mesophila TaxID=1166478 RepID=A0ABS5KBJ8_9BACT|nr:hypothetical protein [Carboxylicivirga mesophila]MBS2212267.1 hypothetical protein [Carboxylicivirga mesophila]
MKKIYCQVIYLLCFLNAAVAQTPVVYKEVKLDPLLCLQINNFEVAQSIDDLKKIPLKYNAKCESVDFGKINFEKKSVVVCSQYVRNGETAIKTTKVEVLRNDQAKRIDVYFASFGNAQIQRPGKVYENRKWLLMPKFPENYKVDVHYSLKVVEP